MYFKFSVIFSSLLALSHGLHASAAPSPQADLICHTNDPAECYPRVFEATEEFQIVHEDQELPKGLHVRLDLGTGLKQAKINDGSSDGVENAVQVIAGEEPVVINSEPDLDAHLDDFQHKFQKALNSQPKDHGAVKPPMTGGSGDGETFSSNNAIIHSASSTSPDATTLVPALENLEDLSHDIYWGLNLAKDSSSVHKLNNYISLPSVDSKIRSTAALLLGTAIQNNPSALSAVLEHFYNDEFPIGPLETVLTALLHEQLPALQARLIYLLSELCADSSQLQKFLYADGLEFLRTLFDAKNASKDQKDKLRQKISNFVLDHFLMEDSLAGLSTRGASGSETKDSWVIVDPNAGVHSSENGKPKAVNIASKLQPWCKEFKTGLEVWKKAKNGDGESEAAADHVSEAYEGLENKLKAYGCGCDLVCK